MINNNLSMNQRPRTIQIFLPTGDSRGIRTAALTTSFVQIIEVPRSLLAQFFLMPESKQVGVYYHIGDDEEKDQLSVYTGQTSTLGKRLNEHHLDPKRAFWNRALVVISGIHSLTQTHAMYLEWRSIQQINVAQRYSAEKWKCRIKAAYTGLARSGLPGNFRYHPNTCCNLGPANV